MPRITQTNARGWLKFGLFESGKKKATRSSPSNKMHGSPNELVAVSLQTF